MNDLEDDELVLRVEKDPFIGKILGGRYQLVSVLGRGGMGVVYKAHQTDIERDVAVKTLHLSKIIDSHVIKKFRSEAQAVSKVRHPNSVTLYDFGVSDEGVPFLVMEMLEGVSFRKVLKDNAPLKNLGRVNQVFQQVCSALQSAHEAGLVHKDLKPENIMLCNRNGSNSWVYVLDFGIAGMMESEGHEVNEIVGSPPYMSPEQCSMQAVIDHRSDIYSLGVCLFEALSGKFPFQARTAIELLECHISGKPRVLKELSTGFSTYESLSQLISKAMEKRPEKRQASAREFAAELEEAIKKDSKRGMQLKDRMTMEVDTVQRVEFVEHKDVPNEENTETDLSESSKFKGLVDKMQALVQQQKEENAEKAAAEADKKYHFSNCPHCDAPTEQGISLCLSCGRSLAAKEDFSKIRAARGEFSLPKTQEIGNAQTSLSREQSQRARAALQKSRNILLQRFGFAIAGAILLITVFFFAGGGQLIQKALNPQGSESGNLPAPLDLETGASDNSKTSKNENADTANP